MRFLKDDKGSADYTQDDEYEAEDDWMPEEDDFQENILYRTTSLADTPGTFRVQELETQIRGQNPYDFNQMLLEENFKRKETEVYASSSMLQEDFFNPERNVIDDDNYSFMLGMDEEEISENLPFTTQVFNKPLEPMQKVKPVADMEIFSHFGEAGGKVPQGLNETRPYCNCSRSQCLKLYCLCFRKGIACHKNCNCIGCLNRIDNQDTVKLKRNQKIVRKMSEADISCNCKMSFCEKSYCACNRNGKGCSSLCKCFHCKNQHGSKNS